MMSDVTAMVAEVALKAMTTWYETSTSIRSRRTLRVSQSAPSAMLTYMKGKRLLTYCTQNDGYPAGVWQSLYSLLALKPTRKKFSNWLWPALDLPRYSKSNSVRIVSPMVMVPKDADCCGTKSEVERQMSTPPPSISSYSLCAVS